MYSLCARSTYTHDFIDLLDSFLIFPKEYIDYRLFARGLKLSIEQGKSRDR